MRRQRIGSLEVSALSLGTLPFGKWVDDKTSFAIMDRFAEAGGTFLDTANNYVFWDGGTGDESEEAVGRWLAARGNRDDMVVATKVGARPSTPGTGLENAEGLSSGHVHMTEELFDYAAAEGDVALVAYSTLLAGKYRDKPLDEAYDHPGTTRRLKVLHDVAAELGATVNQVVLAWVLRQGVIPLIGASTLAQLEETLGALDVELDDDQLQRLDSAV